MIRTLAIALFTFALGLLLGLRLGERTLVQSACLTPLAHTPVLAAPASEAAAPALIPIKDVTYATAMASSPHAPPQADPLPAQLDAIRALLKRGELEQAGQQLDALLDQYPWQPDALLLRIHWLSHSGRHHEALELLLERRSLERDPARAARIEAELEPLFDQAIKAAQERSDSATQLALLEQATTQLPQLTRYQWQLADTRFALYQYPAARLALQPLLYDPSWGERARSLDQRISQRLTQADSYSHRLPLHRLADHRLLQLRIGSAELTLLIDTGAGITLLTPDAAIRAGLSLDGRRISLGTVGGTVVAQLAEATLTLPHLTPITLPLAIHDSGLPVGVDGLLGMDLLRHYQFYIDQERDLLLLEEANVR